MFELCGILLEFVYVGVIVILFGAGCYFVWICLFRCLIGVLAVAIDLLFVFVFLISY